MAPSGGSVTRPSPLPQADRDDPAEAGPRAFWQALFFKILVLGGLAALTMWLLMRLRIVTAPILIGFFIAYALNPAVVRLRRWRVPPILALGVPVLAVVTLAVVFVAVVLPTMAHELVFASQHAPQQIYNLVLRADPWMTERFGQPLSSMVDYRNLSGLTQSIATELFGPARSALGWVLSSARDMLVAVGNIVLVVVVAFFLLEDYEKIVRASADLVPLSRLRNVTRVVARIDAVLAGFLRGELLLFAAATVAFTVGLGVMQVPFFLVVGPMAAMMYLVPYVGVLAGGVLCLVLSALAGHTLLHVLGVVGLFATFYLTDLLYLTPRLIGNRVGLRPVVVLLGIIAFGELFGLIGVLLAIPMLATGRILLVEATEKYRASMAYRGDPLTSGPELDDSSARVPDPTPPLTAPTGLP
jgi:predicted PurR-regulated permease PerM